MKTLHIIAWILLVIGGLNWGILGVSGTNIVSYLGSTIETIVYVLVGLSAILEIFTHKNNCACCAKSASGQAM